MEPAKLPEPFAALADTLAADPTVERAQILGRALKAVPELQAWLREQRQFTMRALLDGPHDAADLAPRLQLSKQRVHDIASGHGRTRAKKETKPTT
ncbi:sigma-70 family RNA polymerase sigma factor [Streptomyces murinus]|uniref:sigma-70 family RNA polymerase sigma factor n=1 Tax=Streptomyces murinus TaxID=33900 RepID=UPI0018F4ECE6|nr:sigma-70 family RNA polymerase sigma factor [Streptomyces murinus]